MSKYVTDTISIPRAEYESLKRQAAFLAMLQIAGVDNWEGYDIAREMAGPWDDDDDDEDEEENGPIT